MAVEIGQIYKMDGDYIRIEGIVTDGMVNTMVAFKGHGLRVGGNISMKEISNRVETGLWTLTKMTQREWGQL